MSSSTSSPLNQSAMNHRADFRHSSAATVASVVSLCIVMLVAIIGNVLIIVIFRKFKTVRKQVTNHFLINLAISDLVVALVTMPFWVMWEIDRWQESTPESWNRQILSLVWNALDIVCEASSIANLAVVSIDRLYSVSSPFKHHTTVTPSLAHKIIFGVWGYAIAVASIYLIDTHWKSLVITIFGFVIPLAIMIVCYTKIVLVVRGVRRRWTSNPEANKHFFGRMVNEYKTAKSLGVVMVAFVICWTPFFISSLLYNYCASCVPFLVSNHPVIPTVTKWLHYLNSALNPILYTIFNPSFRGIFRRFYAWCRNKDSYRCTSYEAWYLSSRRQSTNSQRSASLSHSNGNQNSYTSMPHRPSCGSVSTARFEHTQIVPKKEEKADEDVFLDGNTNEGAATAEESVIAPNEYENKLRADKNSSITKSRVSFSDTDIVL